MEITRECVQCLLLPLVILYSVYYFFASIFYDYLSSYFHFYSELPHSPVPRQIICQYRAHQKKNRLKKANATRQIQNENIFGANAFVRYWELLPNTHTYTELHTHRQVLRSPHKHLYTLRLVCVSNKHNRVIKCKRSIVLSSNIVML